jgi:hypothetical protein
MAPRLVHKSTPANNRTARSQPYRIANPATVIKVRSQCASKADRYGHLFPDDLDAVADAFDSAADDLRTITRSPRSRLERESSLSWLFKVGLFSVG